MIQTAATNTTKTTRTITKTWSLGVAGHCGGRGCRRSSRGQDSRAFGNFRGRHGRGEGEKEKEDQLAVLNILSDHIGEFMILRCKT